MTATLEATYSHGPEARGMDRILVQNETFGVMDRNPEVIPYELPKPSVEDSGLMAVLDLGGVQYDKTFKYSDVFEGDQPEDSLEESDMKMLLCVDLKDESGKRWVEGCDIPEGATLAVIDARGIELDENGKVQRGVVFMSPGESLIVGRDKEKAHKGFNTENVKGLSGLHLDIGVDAQGKVLVKDRGSTNGSMYRTGVFAREAVRNLSEEHVRSEHFKMILGAEAIEDTVNDPFGLNEFVSSPVSADEPTVPRRDVVSMVNESQSSPAAQRLSAREEVVSLLNDLETTKPESTEEPITQAQAKEEIGRLFPKSDAVNAENIRLDLEQAGSMLTEQEARNYDKAVATLQGILGANNKGGGTLGEKLRELGATPNDIITQLRKPGTGREAVLRELKTRTSHMYQWFEAEDEKAFLDGVKDGRSKPINVEDAENGEAQVGSLDKVALLALAMLDGTFRHEDDVVKDKAKGGNHRDAAEKVLADFAKAQIIDKVELYSENEEVKKIFESITTVATNTKSKLTGTVIYKLKQLGSAFFDANRVDEDVLYGEVLKVEREREQLSNNLSTLSTNIVNFLSNNKNVADGERTKLDSAAQDIKNIQSIVSSAGAYTEGNFWRELVNAARRHDTDGSSLLRIYNQIVRNRLGDEMADGLQSAVTQLEQYERRT